MLRNIFKKKNLCINYKINNNKLFTNINLKDYKNYQYKNIGNNCLDEIDQKAIDYFDNKNDKQNYKNEIDEDEIDEDEIDYFFNSENSYKISAKLFSK